MKRILPIILLITVLCDTGFAQKKLLVQAGVEILAAKKPVRVALTPTQVLSQVRPFIATHNRRPLSSIYQNGVVVPMDQLSPEIRREVALGAAVQRILIRAKMGKVDPQHPDVIELRRLIEQYPGTHTLCVKELLSQLQDFLASHNGKRPRALFYKNSRAIPTEALTPEQLTEARLARQVMHVIKWAKKTGNINDPDTQALVKAWGNNRPPAPSDSELLEKLNKWVASHNGVRPRLTIYDEHCKNIPIAQMTTQEREEHTLARQMERKLREGISDKQIREAMWVIKNLPTSVRR